MNSDHPIWKYPQSRTEEVAEFFAQLHTGVNPSNAVELLPESFHSKVETYKAFCDFLEKKKYGRCQRFSHVLAETILKLPFQAIQFLFERFLVS